MLYDNRIWVGTSPEGAVSLLPSMANRHGLISGATGTGKTVTLQVLAEGFSSIGVPVFLADVKGDLGGLCRPGENSEKIAGRLQKCGFNASFPFRGSPVVFWDVYGEKGHPIRATVSQMGPLLFSRLLQLNDVQSGIMYLIFKIADAEGLLLIDLKDVKAMLTYVGENASKYTLEYGNISKASIGAIQRSIAVLEDQGGDKFFGEPALDIIDWMTQDDEGRGCVNVLAADRLYRNPVMYSTFLLWMLGQLYDILPEVGDREKPQMVFFFDEAHLLFSDCSKTLLDRVEQTVKLIRSKGVGVYFITQNPTDISTGVLSQLSNRVQHALRAYTPQEQKVVKAVAQTFRVNPSFDTEKALTELKTGEALLSFLQEDGSPMPAQKAIILPPQGAIGTISDEMRATWIKTDAVGDKYDVAYDRDSAYEYLAGLMAQREQAAPVVVESGIDMPQPTQNMPVIFKVFDPATGTYVEREAVLPQAPAMPYQAPASVTQPAQPAVQQAKPTVLQGLSQILTGKPAVQEEKPVKTAQKTTVQKSFGNQLLESFTKSATNSAGRTLGSQLTRSLLGTLGLTGSTRKKTTKR